MATRFFHRTSYHSTPYSLAKDASSIQPIGIREYIEKDLNIAFNPDFDLSDITKVRHDVAHSVKFYTDKLAKLDPVGFYYLNEHQRIACEETLMYTFYIVSADYQLHLFERNNERAKKRVKQLERCANLLNILRKIPIVGEKRSLEQGLQEAIDDSPDKPAAYIGLTIIAPEIAKTMLSLTTRDHLRTLKKTMSDANFYRLNWVWGGGLDRILLDLMPKGFEQSEQAANVFARVAPITGYMSWVLYYLRLGIELYLLATHTFNGAWSEIGDRFKTQWDLRKFSILNDAFWATANMACFFWLCGSGTLGYLGNALTGLLLIFDLSLMAWGYQEKKADHEKRLYKYEEDIQSLTAKIDLDNELNAIQKNVLREHRDLLIEEKETHALDWTYAEKQWQHDLWYAAALFASFSILCCFFFPPAGLLPAAVLILGVIGASLSFLITIGAHAWATSTEIAKLTDVCDRHETKLNALCGELAQLKSDDNPESTLKIKKLELDISHRQTDLSHEKSMIKFHKMQIIQQTLSEALVPATAFAILVFMPLGVGIFVLIPTVALLMMSGTLLGLSEPNEPDSPKDEMPLVNPLIPTSST